MLELAAARAKSGGELSALSRYHMTRTITSPENVITPDIGRLLPVPPHLQDLKAKLKMGKFEAQWKLHEVLEYPSS